MGKPGLQEQDLPEEALQKVGSSASDPSILGRVICSRNQITGLRIYSVQSILAAALRAMRRG